MLKEKLLHPATIIATLALLVALSGAGYAATKIGTAQLKNGAVTKAKIKNNAVTGAKISGGAVGSKDLARGAVTSGKIAGGAVTGPGLATGAVTSSKLAGGAVGGAALGNGSVTNAKLGPNAVTGAKIAGSTITAANIQNGQVVKGNGSLLTANQLLPAGAVETTVLALPGVGLLRASCPAGEPVVSFTNQSGATARVTAWGVDGSSNPVMQLTSLASGLSTAGIPATGLDSLGLHYQVAFAGPGGVQEVTTAAITAGPSGTGCAVTAQALTTG